MRKHVIITGTGRAGTSFLVELFTNLGLDTGFTSEDLTRLKDSLGRAGLERGVRSENSPYIIKSPWFCDYADEVFSREDIAIEHIIIPIRNLNAAAQSRIHVTRAMIKELSIWDRIRVGLGLKEIKPQGGVWHMTGTNSTRQEFILLNQIYKLMLAASGTGTKITLIKYPLLTQDPLFLFQKVKPIIGGIAFETFLNTFNQTVQPELVHRFNGNDH